jgi:putative ABC transport system permease protein
MLMLGIDGANLFFDGEPQTTSIQQNSLVVPNHERDLLLDLDDQPITAVAPGTIVLPVLYQVEAGLAGRRHGHHHGSDGFAKDLTIAGFARDSIMNPAITSSKRLAVAPSDLEEVRAHTGEVEHLSRSGSTTRPPRRPRSRRPTSIRTCRRPASWSTPRPSRCSR